MEQIKRKFWPIVIIIALIILVVVLVSWQNRGVNKIVKIGFIGPLSGPAVAYGDYTRKAFELGLDEWNASHIDKMEAIYEDGKCSPGDAVTAANKLISADRVNFLVTFCTGETNAVAPIAQRNKVILLTPGSTAPDVAKGEYIFRNIGSDDSGLPALSRIAYGHDKHIALISEDTDYAISTKDGFKQKYSGFGGTVIFDESFNSKNLDFRTMIAKLKNAGIQSIFVVVQSMDNSAVLFKQMNELNYHPKIFTTESTISNGALLKYQKGGYENIAEGAVFVQQYFDRENPIAKKMLASYTDKFGSSKGPVGEYYLATFYDAVYLIGDAVESVGNNPDTVSNYFLANIHDWKGAVGTFSFDKTGDAVVETQTNIVKDGKIIEYKE